MHFPLTLSIDIEYWALNIEHLFLPFESNNFNFSLNLFDDRRPEMNFQYSMFNTNVQGKMHFPLSIEHWRWTLNICFTLRIKQLYFPSISLMIADQNEFSIFNVQYSMFQGKMHFPLSIELERWILNICFTLRNQNNFTFPPISFDDRRPKWNIWCLMHYQSQPSPYYKLGYFVHLFESIISLQKLALFIPPLAKLQLILLTIQSSLWISISRSEKTKRHWSGRAIAVGLLMSFHRPIIGLVHRQNSTCRSSTNLLIMPAMYKVYANDNALDGKYSLFKMLVTITAAIQQTM